MKKLIRRRSGFSLIEMMITMVVFGAVIGAIYQVLISSTKSVGRGKMAANVQQNLRVGMDEMIKDLRQAGYGLAQLPAFSKAAQNEIRFWADVDNQSPTELIRYYIGDPAELLDTQNPNDAMLYRDDSGEAQPIPIAQGIRQIQFQYYDAAGVALLNGPEVAADPMVADMNGNGEPDINDIRSIEISLIFETARPDARLTFNNGYLQYQLTTKIHPVNLNLIVDRGEPDSILSLVIIPDPAPTILVGEQFQFKSIATFAASGTRDVTDQSTWVSSDTTIAGIGTFVPGSIAYNDEGLATAKANGTTNISCVYKGVVSSNTVLLKVGGPETRLVRINGAANYVVIEGTAGMVTLTAEITDIGYGSTNIIAAQYNIPVMGLGGAMAAIDGAFDSPVENVTATIDVSAFTTSGSPYFFYVQGRSAGSPLSWGPADNAVLTVLDSDNVGPIVEAFNAAPDVTIPEGTPTVTITANLNDFPTGGSNILEGEMFIGTRGPAGTGTPLSATDGAFDSPLEGITFTIDTSGWLMAGSPYRVFVAGRDIVGNWGSDAFLDITVTSSDTEGPLVTAFTGPGSIAAATSQLPVNGMASEVTTGGAKVVAVEAFADTDPGLGAATAMTPVDGAFDSTDESFTGFLNSFPWPAGSTHVIYARAQDEYGNWGPTNSFNVNVTSSINGRDVVMGLVNGNFEVWHGDGVGGFGGHDTYSTLVTLKDLLIADLNADTHSDVVISSSEGEVQIWLNDGFGNLGIVPSQVINVGAPVHAISAGDFNNDTMIDLIVPTQTGLVLYYQNDGTGVLNASNYLAYENTHLDFINYSEVADLNSDGFLDVVIAGVTTSSTTKEFQPLLHPGAAGGDWLTQKHRHYAGLAAGIGVADYTGDGLLDVAVAVNDPAGNGIQLWTDDGIGGYTEGAVQLWTDDIQSMHSMDYDRDGDIDIMLGTNGISGNEIYVSPNNGSGLFDTVSPQAAAIGLPAAAVAFGFFDGDIDPDVVSGGSAALSLFTFLQQPANNLLQSVNSPFPSGAAAVIVRVGEIN